MRTLFANEAISKSGGRLLRFARSDTISYCESAYSAIEGISFDRLAEAQDSQSNQDD